MRYNKIESWYYMKMNLSKHIILINQDSIPETFYKKLAFSKVALKAKVTDITNVRTLPSRHPRIALCFNKEDIVFARQNDLAYYFISDCNLENEEHFIAIQEATEEIEKTYKAAIYYCYVIPDATYLILVIFVLMKLYFIVPYWLLLFIAQFIFCKIKLHNLNTK